MADLGLDCFELRIFLSFRATPYFIFYPCHSAFVTSLINDQIRILQVPVAAAVYYEDMYVNFKLSMETASEISGIRLWITNEFMHSGLRDGGDQVLDQLFGMLKGRKPVF